MLSLCRQTSRRPSSEEHSPALSKGGTPCSVFLCPGPPVPVCVGFSTRDEGFSSPATALSPCLFIPHHTR